MKTWRRGILVGIIALIAMIQVLPQVDLPDTTSHEDDVPVIEKARLTTVSVPVLISTDSVSTILVETTLSPMPRPVMRAEVGLVPPPNLDSALRC